MKIGKLNEVTGKTVKEWCEWLKEENMGCCSLCYEYDDTYRYCVCVGWSHAFGSGDEWQIAWKIGRQTLDNAMQCDFDLDFEFPSDEETGDCDATGYPIELSEGAAMKEWNAIATTMRKDARRIWKTWRMSDED